MVKAKRLAIMPTDRTYSALKELSELSGVPMSTLMRGILDDFTPTLEKLVEGLKAPEGSEIAFVNAWISGVKREALDLSELEEVERGDG